MAFTVAPKAAPTSDNQPSQAAQDARARAIAKLTGGQASQQSQATPVANPNSVSPEEFGALAATKRTEATQSPVSEASPEGQKDNVEASSDAAPSEVKKEEPLSPQFAMLARKEKALRAKVEAFKQQEATLQAREEAIKAKEAEFGTNDAYVSKEALLADPVGLLNSLGLSYDQLTEQVMSRPALDPTVKSLIDDLKSEIKTLRDGQENQTKSQKEQQTQAYQQAVKQLKAEATQLVSSDAAFETIKETGSVDDVVELIEATYREDGYLMTVEDAAKAVEEHLIEEALKLSKLKKIQQRLQPAKAAEPAPAKEQAAAPQQSQPAKTLTNAMGTQRKMTARERAILAFEGKNKQ